MLELLLSLIFLKRDSNAGVLLLRNFEEYLRTTASDLT